MPFCLSCDADIRGTVYAFGTHSPLCRKCCYELEGLENERLKKLAQSSATRELSWLGRLFFGLFGRRK